MAEKLSLALAQLNPTVGDISGNADKLRLARKKAAAAGADLLVTSELYISSYPPADLVLKPSFQHTVHQAVEELAKETADKGPAILLGAPWAEDGKIYNAVLLLAGGMIKEKIYKRDLPNYGPFDEKRVFTAGGPQEPVEFKGIRLGVMICEDMWTPTAGKHLKERGAQILIVPNSSPYETGKFEERQKLAQLRVRETGLPIVYMHQVGGQDELVFDGASFAMDAKGNCVTQVARWEEDLAISNWSVKSRVCDPEGPAHVKEVSRGEAAVYSALMLALRDYVTKNGFPGVVLGMSGGIDSALVAALAVDALGPDKVWAVMMPSPYTSQDSLDDAAAMVKLLGCRYDIIPINDGMEMFGRTLAPIFKDKPLDLTEENIQSRCRGVILMALSNKFGPMVISTGNKSEVAVGYSTLYGDLCGGYAILKDVYKTQVFKIAQWRNAAKPATALGPFGIVTPIRIITKAPSAELRPNQKDEDSLPAYVVLDDILECLIEKDMGLNDIVARGHSADVIRKVWSLLDRAEYKRRQAPPGVKVTRRHLSLDRRYPITNKYRET